MVSTAGGIVIAIVVLLLAAAVGWVGYTQVRARKLGVRFHVPFSSRMVLGIHQKIRSIYCLL